MTEDIITKLTSKMQIGKELDGICCWGEASTNYRYAIPGFLEADASPLLMA